MFPHQRDGGDPLTRHNYYNYVNIIIYYERRSVPTILPILFLMILYIREPRVACTLSSVHNISN